MKRSFLLVISIIMICCTKKESNFEYDPTVPYPILNPGEFWLDKFDERGLQNAVVYHDKIYCNTIDVGGDSNFLYCLNPKDGNVVWRAHVDAFASQPASFQGDTVIYCSYLGDISAFDNKGKTIWKAKFDDPYGGHCVDTINSTLLVKTVYWKYVSKYDIKSGKLISRIENDSLQSLIYAKMRDSSSLKEHKYQFTGKDKTYAIKCKPFMSVEVWEHKIEISKNIYSK
ncbi:PQQ-binding-like beta-propeller repeat protein [Flavobacterium sp. P21]|uniref:outer membrane protein assembly factor BamB family protein n=1 Tax=Flavobacterium sp. P21 TaxID=3423948 RepID=UPI003D666A42